MSASSIVRLELTREMPSTEQPRHDHHVYAVAMGTDGLPVMLPFVKVPFEDCREDLAAYLKKVPSTARVIYRLRVAGRSRSAREVTRRAWFGD